MSNASNIIWHPHSVTPENREKLNGHRGACIWFTGLSGSGKSTIANELERQFNSDTIHSFLLDGDNIRKGLNKDLGFSEGDRVENIRRISEVSKLFVDAGVIVLTAFISPFRKERDFARSIISHEQFIEVYVDVSINECMERDPKGLYKKAKSGELKDFTGIDSPYEPPENPEIVIKNTKGSDIQNHVKAIIEYLKRKKFI